MRKLLVVLFLVGAAAQVDAQRSETRQVGRFDGVKSAEGIDVYLKKGQKESVKVEIEGDLQLSNVITEVSGSYLKIHFSELKGHKNVHAKVFVTYRQLNMILASSASNVYSEGPITSDDLEIGVSSAASVELQLNVQDLEVDVSSAGDVELEGKANRVSLEASSAGKIDAFDLDAKEVEASCSSAGSIRLSVKDELDAEASSGGSIRYRGNPSKSTTNSSSGGSVKKSP